MVLTILHNDMASLEIGSWPGTEMLLVLLVPECRSVIGAHISLIQFPFSNAVLNKAFKKLCIN